MLVIDTCSHRSGLIGNGWGYCGFMKEGSDDGSGEGTNLVNGRGYGEDWSHGFGDPINDRPLDAFSGGGDWRVGRWWSVIPVSLIPIALNSGLIEEELAAVSILLARTEP